MNLASLIILLAVAAAFIAAVRYTRKHGTCSGCSTGSGGCGGSCSGCAMRPLEEEAAGKMMEEKQLNQ